jgi:hypothetical protein
MSPSPSLRPLIASMGGLARSAKYDGRAVTATARGNFLARFEREVRAAAELCGEQLTDAEVDRRVAALRRFYFRKLAYESVKARAVKRTRSSDAPATVTPELNREVDGGTSTDHQPE